MWRTAREIHVKINPTKVKHKLEQKEENKGEGGGE